MIGALLRIPAYKLMHLLGRGDVDPINVTISTTFRCNSRCLTCNVYERPVDELSVEEWGKVFEALGRSPVWFTFSGGEPFLRKVFLGAQRRAAQMGFDLEEFWTSEPGMTDRRLQQIIRARGIVGVVLSPVTTDEASLVLDWDWREFSAAVIGNVTWTPELHHAGHHHYLGMRTALVGSQELAASSRMFDEAKEWQFRESLELVHA